MIVLFVWSLYLVLNAFEIKAIPLVNITFDPCMGLGVPLGVWEPDPVKVKNNLQYLPCIEQRPLL